MITVSCVKTDTIWSIDFEGTLCIPVLYVYHIYIYMAFVFESFWRWFVTPCPIYILYIYIIYIFTYICMYIYIHLYVSFPTICWTFPTLIHFCWWLLGLGRLWKSPRTVITWDVFSFWRYCWWTKSCTTNHDDYPIIYRVLTIPGGAGFCPSTVFFNYLYLEPVCPLFLGFNKEGRFQSIQGSFGFHVISTGSQDFCPSTIPGTVFVVDFRYFRFLFCPCHFFWDNGYKVFDMVTHC